MLRKLCVCRMEKKNSQGTAGTETKLGIDLHLTDMTELTASHPAARKDWNAALSHLILNSTYQPTFLLCAPLDVKLNSHCRCVKLSEPFPTNAALVLLQCLLCRMELQHGIHQNRQNAVSHHHYTNQVTSEMHLQKISALLMRASNYSAAREKGWHLQ